MPKKTLFCLFFAIVTGLLAVSASPAATVKGEVFHSQDRYPAGGRYPLIFRFTIQRPWYLHGTKADENSLIPTSVSFERLRGLEVRDFRFPAPEKKKFEYTPEPVEVFSGEVLVEASLLVRDDAAPGEREIKGRLSYQACSATSCLPPETAPITVALSIVPPKTPTVSLNREIFHSRVNEAGISGSMSGFRPGAGFWLTLLGLFLGGLALNFTPCIYPLIPITVSYFGGRNKTRPGWVLSHAILYMLGLAFTNAVLGVSAALSGEMLGSALQNPLVLVFVALILVGLASSFFGFWEFRLPSGLTQLASRNFGGHLGSLFMGLTLGIVAAPCIGPFILGLLTYVGQKGDPLLGFAYFFVLSLGIGLPLAILGLFSGAVQKLPLSGDWMLWVRKLMGWVLVGMAVHLLGPLVPTELGKSGLLAGVAVAAALHLGWLDRSGASKRGFLLFKRTLGVVLVMSAGLFFFITAYEPQGIAWTPYGKEALAAAAREKRPVILDFYADWCGPCVIMEKTVFRDPEVVRLSRDFVTLRLDLTARPPLQEEILSEHGVMGVPTVVFLDIGGREVKPLRVEYLVGKEIFLERMKRLLPEPVPSTTR